MEHSVDGFEKQRAAFEAIMEEAPPSSPDSKLLEEMSTRLSSMEYLLPKEDLVDEQKENIIPERKEDEAIMEEAPPSSPDSKLLEEMSTRLSSMDYLLPKEDLVDEQKENVIPEQKEDEAIMEEAPPSSPVSMLLEEMTTRISSMEYLLPKKDLVDEQKENVIPEQKEDVMPEQKEDVMPEQIHIQDAIQKLKMDLIEQNEVITVQDDSIIILDDVEKSDNSSLSRANPPIATPAKKAIIKPTMLPNSEIRVSSLQPPQHKVFRKTQPFTNKTRMLNALQYAVFPGQVNSGKLTKAKKDVGDSAAKHFLVLFRDDRCQFRGLYTWDQKSSVVHKLSGIGPAQCLAEEVKVLFKYNSGGKRFDKLEAKDFANVVDGFAIDDSFWIKSKTTQGAAASCNAIN